MSEIAIVGCGHIHIGGFVNKIKERSDVHVKYVWDHDAARAAKWAAQAAAPVVDDVKKIWRDKSINAVAICSETNLHKALVLAAVRARKHLFVEKPLGMGARDGYAMAKAIEKAGVLFQTGYFMRGNPVHLYLKQLLGAGSFGKVTRIRGSNCHQGSLDGWFDTEWRWMADPKIAGVGAFGDLGTHSLDIMLWLLGEVTAATAHVDKGTARYGECDETGEGLMRFANGAIGTLAAAWTDLANPVSLIISGTQAHAAVIGGQLHLVSKNIEGADGKQPWTNLPAGVPAGFDAFLDAIGGKTDVTLVTAREAAYRSAVMEAMYEGAARNKWIKPREMPTVAVPQG